MVTQPIMLQVPTQQQIDMTASMYIAQGFVIANRTPTSATLIKRKELNIVLLIICIVFIWTFVGLILLIVLLIAYANESDRMIVVYLAGTQPPLPMVPVQPYMPQQPQPQPQPYAAQPLYGASQPLAGGSRPLTGGPQPLYGASQPLSYGNPATGGGLSQPNTSGNLGMGSDQTIPPNAPRSPDGYYWWDGQQWRPVTRSLSGDLPRE